MNYTLDDYFKEAGIRLTIPFAPHVTMKFRPRPDQVRALNQSVYYLRYLNASDPGVGKTVAAQAWGLYWLSEGIKVLVAMPPALLYQFRESLFDTYRGIGRYVTCHVLDEPPAKRQKLMEQWDAGDEWPQFLLVSYQKLRTLAPQLRSRGYYALMCDEAHALKNPESMVHKIVQEYVGGESETALLCMTGTPVVNELMDAYGLTRLINPSAYPSLKAFKRDHCIYRTIPLKEPRKLRGGGLLREIKVLSGYRDIGVIHQHLYRYGLRVLKEDVLSLLEPTIIEVPLRLDSKHLRLYEKLATEKILEIGDELITALQEQGLRQKLLQIVTCPQLFVAEGEKITNEVFKTAEAIIDSVGVRRTKFTLFANFQATVEALSEYFAEYQPAIIYGASKDANAERLRFINDPDCRLLIANPVSAGAGLDGLQTVSHTMIFVEPTGVPGQFSQCVARLQRGGQTRPVTVYVLKALDTASPKIIRDMRRKTANVQEVNADRDSLLNYFVVRNCA